MARIVKKFGGTSVADIEKIQNVARRIKKEVDAGNQVAVVVSAMAGVTNQLVGYVDEISRLYDAREYDCRRRVRRAGDRWADGFGPPGDGRPGPLVARLADPDPYRCRAWQGAYRIHRW